MVVANYAVEDALSESVLLCCFRHSGIEAGKPMVRSGFGYLKKIAPALNKTASGIPYVMLTDLDNRDCAPGLIDSWLAHKPRHEDFLFRVAVREVEAWLLADTENFAEFLGVDEAVLPNEFEALVDPKLELLKTVRRSRHRRIREDVVFEAECGPVQGPDYNGALSRFVRGEWDLERAASRCPSLQRLLDSLMDLNERKSG